MAGSGCAMPDDSRPTAEEVKQQLARMLGGKRFAAAVKQAPFLKYVVEAALRGEPTDEDAIGYDLFPKFVSDQSTDVRVTAGNLRSRLDKYYADEGRDDPVMILLPEPPPSKKGEIRRPTGEAYRPFFIYNPNHPVDQDYRRGRYYLSQCTPADDTLALDHFGFALERQPDHAASHAGKAEVFLRRAMVNPGNAPTATNLDLAAHSVNEALRCSPALWRAHALRGVLHGCHGKWREAGQSFDRALQKDEFQTRYGAWYYPAYLMAVGRTDEALVLVRTCAEENPDDLPSQLAQGVFLYAARRYEEALYSLAAANTMNPRQWIARTVSALVALAQREPATAHVILAHRLVGEELFPGLLLLCYAAELRLRKTPEQWGASRRAATDDLFSSVYRALGEIADTLPSPSEQLARVLKHAGKHYVSPLQLGLAYLALNRTRSAAAQLKRARRENHPLAAWLHLWPVLDPLNVQAL